MSIKVLKSMLCLSQSTALNEEWAGGRRNVLILVPTNFWQANYPIAIKRGHIKPPSPPRYLKFRIPWGGCFHHLISQFLYVCGMGIGIGHNTLPLWNQGRGGGQIIPPPLQYISYSDVPWWRRGCFSSPHLSVPELLQISRGCSKHQDLINLKSIHWGYFCSAFLRWLEA